jgi:hypothetical protein
MAMAIGVAMAGRAVSPVMLGPLVGLSYLHEGRLRSGRQGRCSRECDQQNYCQYPLHIHSLRMRFSYFITICAGAPQG